jgi:rod shape-determining protein MreD
MRALRLALALLLVAILHFVGMLIVPWFFLAVDLFLVVLVFNAMDGDTLAGMLGGMAAGLVTDALTGGPFGLFGIADTIVGYSTAAAGQRLVIQRASSSLLVFCLAAAAQQALVFGVAFLILPNPEAQDLRWVLIKVATSGVLGLILYQARARFLVRMDTWRRNRTSRVRFGR